MDNSTKDSLYCLSNRLFGPTPITSAFVIADFFSALELKPKAGIKNKTESTRLEFSINTSSNSI